MMFRIHSLLITALIAFCALNSHALESGKYFQAITTSGVINKSLWYEHDGKKVEVYANNTIRSIDYDYDLAPSIIFYGNRTNAKGIPIPEAVARLPYSAEDLPTKAGRLLLIFHKVANNPSRGPSYNILVIEDKLESFPLGSFRFINFLDKKIAVRLGSKDFIVENNKEKIVEIASPEKGDLTIKLASMNDAGSWVNFYSNGWGHANDLRTIVFLTKSENGIKPLRFRQYAK